ncbi:MAG: hypothetical protein JXR45_01115, partial [Deltaproteobacteria bacterium]|nr:hypothetical protein [Deltaproteobacteria bacterium]
DSGALTDSDTSSDSDSGALTDSDTSSDSDSDTDTGTDSDTDTQNDSVVHTIVVTTTSDVLDGDTTSIDALIADPGADGETSLREAISACNYTRNDGAPDQIHFDIADAAPYTIAVSGTALPDITDPVSVDGSTEPDYIDTPLIALDGNGLSGTESGVTLTSGSDGSTIRSLVVIRFPENGLLINSSDNNTIQDMYLGIGLDGVTRQGNGGSGLNLLESGSNQIGGEISAGPNERNVFSGNTMHGIILDGSGSNNNTLTGNIVGLDRSGTITAQNARNGIVLINGAHHNIIGGTDSFERNVISGNRQTGIRIVGTGTDYNEIMSNNIGSDIYNSADDTVGNGWAGIRIYQYAQHNLIGGDLSRTNFITFNGYDGVEISGLSPKNNPVLGNYIAYNGLLGIDLGTDETVTPNDAGDVDEGDNDLLNFPEFTSAAYNAGSGEVTVNYNLDVPAGDYRIEFFQNVAVDDSGYGEGAIPTHAETITHSGTGAESFSATFIATEAYFISATTTEILGVGEYGSTSEFSLAVPTTWVPDGCVRYVDINASAASETGLSWAEAFSDIQSGVDAAAAESPECEVWVATGSYILMGGTDDTIVLQPNVAIYGGFGGLATGDTLRTQRDPSWSVNPTVVSGNNQSYHVFVGAANTRLDGFTIVAGNADGGIADSYGAGLYTTSGPMTIDNCRFVDNYAAEVGGAIWVNNATMAIFNSDFTSNSSGDGFTTGYGGAIAADSSTIQIDNVVFRTNGGGAFTLYGSALYFTGSNTFISNSEFTDNVAAAWATGYFNGGTHELFNLLFMDNTGALGGSVFAASNAHITATNLVAGGGNSTSGAIDVEGTGILTLINNTVHDTGLCYTDNLSTSATIVNSILWSTDTASISSAGAAPTISYSIITGGAPGTQVSAADPHFTSAPADVSLLPDSPAIDAGNGDVCPTSDYNGDIRYDAPVSDTGIGIGTPTYTDIGAFEYSP